jgi:hypothetical protein
MPKTPSIWIDEDEAAWLATPTDYQAHYMLVKPCPNCFGKKWQLPCKDCKGIGQVIDTEGGE